MTTRENQDKPWLLFEAGALSKQIGSDEDGRVIPLLVDMPISDLLPGPLTQFQARMLNVTDLERIADELADMAKVSKDTIRDRIAGKCQEIVARANDAATESAKTPEVTSTRSDGEVLREILKLARDIYRRQDVSQLAHERLNRPRGVVPLEGVSVDMERDIKEIIYRTMLRLFPGASPLRLISLEHDDGGRVLASVKVAKKVPGSVKQEVIDAINEYRPDIDFHIKLVSEAV